ncbi:branched-chain amino acid ABC transporter permease [Acidimangrovimonas sediminis]|uniref:branched-chain amino acid ABC transporter permease n=1 Tax=Acidimangrovimonas sediminis TaxID=2056283 RepID=UPI000C7FBC73|nr:branched-chain amino acid ABC transporter permease [Acidimangrovimonas sediminis]
MTFSKTRRLAMTGLRLGLLAVVVVLAFGPGFLEVGTMRLCAQVFLLMVLAMMWNLLAGYADIVTVGQHAFVGIGAYALYGLTAKAGLSLPVAILGAGAVALVLAVPITAIVFRMRAAYLAIGTWVVAEVCTLLASKIPGYGGATGITLPGQVIRALGGNVRDRFANLYWISLGLVVVAYLATALLLRSRVGVGLMAMRDNEEAAGAIGVNLVASRIICFLWAALFLGLAGGVLALLNLRIQPAASFSLIDYTVYVIFAAVIGGVGSIEGAIIGVLVYVGLRNAFSDYSNLYLMFLGALSILIMLVEPRGIWGLIRRVLPENIILVSHPYRGRAGREQGES